MDNKVNQSTDTDYKSVFLDFLYQHYKEFEWYADGKEVYTTTYDISITFSFFINDLYITVTRGVLPNVMEYVLSEFNEEHTGYDKRFKEMYNNILLLIQKRESRAYWQNMFWKKVYETLQDTISSNNHEEIKL